MDKGGKRVLTDDVGALPKRLRQLRLELGWSLDDVAQVIQASHKAVVSNWEATNARHRTPPLGTLAALARWYGVSMDYLIGVRGADRDSPLVRLGKAALKERFPLRVKGLENPSPGARFRLAVMILEEAAPEAFFSGRIAANLLVTAERLDQLLADPEPPDSILERFAHFADMPAAWFYLRPEHI